LKFPKFLLNQVIAPLVVLFFAPAVVAISSRLETGEWINWFTNIPLKVYYLFTLFIIGWLIIVLVNQRIKKVNKLNSTIYNNPIITNPPFGWHILNEKVYSGVVWIIKYALTESQYLQLNSLNPSNVVAKLPPRCPRCKTELEQLHSFWGGYIWNCVQCNFKKRNKFGFSFEKQGVEMIARREFEKNMEAL